jgi:hypothetical protein
VLSDELSRLLLFSFFLDRVQAHDVDRVQALAPVIAAAGDEQAAAEARAGTAGCSSLRAVVRSLCSALQLHTAALLAACETTEAIAALASALFPQLLLPLAARVQEEQQAEAVWKECRPQPGDS